MQRGLLLWNLSLSDSGAPESTWAIIPRIATSTISPPLPLVNKAHLSVPELWDKEANHVCAVLTGIREISEWAETSQERWEKVSHDVKDFEDKSVGLRQKCEII